jgi:HD-GYP domain-containing protein (c-di-GMP phosphodiesterase class II)
VVGLRISLNDESGRAVAGLLAGQALCLAVGFGMGAIWLSSDWSGWALGLGVIVALAIQGGTLCVGLRRLQLAAELRQAEAESRANAHREDLHRTQRAVMYGLAHLSESRDPATGEHLRRMKHLARALAEALQTHPNYRTAVTPEFIKQFEISAMLHDIGKVGISDAILLKPGKLTQEERHEMQQHPLISSQCLRRIEEKLGAANFLEMAHEIALYHHERWDGLGYPFGRRGAAIPLSARIVAIADVYDALVSERVYKPAFPHEQCVAMIREGAGTQFDPELVKVFLSIERRFADISDRIRENDPSLSMHSFQWGLDKAVAKSSTDSFESLDDLLQTLDLETSPRAGQLVGSSR